MKVLMTDKGLKCLHLQVLASSSVFYLHFPLLAVLVFSKLSKTMHRTIQNYFSAFSVIWFRKVLL